MKIQCLSVIELLVFLRRRNGKETNANKEKRMGIANVLIKLIIYMTAMGILIKSHFTVWGIDCGQEK